MKHYSKQFTEWVINLKRNPFEQARLKLTGYYLVVMLFIITIFSFVVINLVEKNIRDTLDDSVQDIRTRQEIFNRTSDDIQTGVLVVDGLLLLIVGGLGYFLAGKTLLPIKKNFEAQKRFTADASHDLRTPLTIMKTEIEVVLQSNHESNEKYRKVLTSGLEEIEIMSSLVEDLLTLARSEGVNKHEELVNYSPLLLKLQERITPQAITKNIKIKLDIKTEGTILVHVRSFTRALQNILDNAVNYTNQNGTIDIALIKHNKQLILTISDTGVGISSEDLPHIFDRFYKASHSRNDATGSGLGLSIAKELIERYRGTIRITSELNKGTTVTVTMSLT